MDAVENELGLCARIEATHAALLRSIASGGSCCAAWRLEHRSASEATAEPALPPLAELVRAQRYTRPRMCSVDAPALLRPPLLYGALVHNRDPEHERTVEALQASWRLPPQSAFLLSDMTRWPELAALRPAGGYRVILADPPWHSHSAQVGPSRCCPPPLAALLLLQLLLTLLQHTAPPPIPTPRAPAPLPLPLAGAARRRLRDARQARSARAAGAAARRQPRLPALILGDELAPRAALCGGGPLPALGRATPPCPRHTPCPHPRHTATYRYHAARSGARLVARWYWLKVAADGRLAIGAAPRSPHRKPWEPLLLAHLGVRRAWPCPRARDQEAHHGELARSHARRPLPLVRGTGRGAARWPAGSGAARARQCAVGPLSQAAPLRPAPPVIVPAARVRLCHGRRRG